MRSACAFILVCLLSTTGFGSEELITQGMQETLDSIESAVLDQDAGAFMAIVDISDPVRTQEIRAWFADLNRNPVMDFEITPIDGVRYGPLFTPAKIPVEIRWRLESDSIERSLSQTLTLVPLNRNADSPWLYAGKYWGGPVLSDEEGLRVFSEKKHATLAEDVREIVPAILRAIERDLDLMLSEPLTIKIYPDMQALQYSIAPGYINPISGWNEPGESIKILGRDDVSAERISSLLAHEIGHAVSFEFGDQTINAPWWSLEGIAELVADEYRSTPPEIRIVRIAKQVAQGDRRTWDQLSDFKGEALNHSRYVYSQGWSMVRYITMSFGKKARNAWFTEMGQGASVEEATQSALKISFDDLDRAWEAEMISIAEQAED